MDWILEIPEPATRPRKEGLDPETIVDSIPTNAFSHSDGFPVIYTRIMEISSRVNERRITPELQEKRHP